MQDFWLFLHVLSAVVAFGAGFAGPMLTRSVDGTGVGVGFSKVAAFIQAPALVVLLFSGIMEAYTFRPREIFAEAWISIAFTLWIISAVVMFFQIRALRNETKAVAALSGIQHTVLLVALWAMIWQPGAPG